MPARPAAPITAISLFTGAGGLDLGLGRTGAFKLLACVEKNATFCETLRRNRDRGLFGDAETQILDADLSALSPDTLMESVGLSAGDVDLVVGGPPCQSFSTAGRRRTVADPRGTLVWDFLRFVEALRPKAFLMENVRGLLSAALRHRPIAERPGRGGPSLAPDETPGSVMQQWVDDLLQIGPPSYRVDLFEVNAVNYGAPQLRERVLVFGNRLGHVVEFPVPTHGPPGSAQQQLLSGTQPFRTLGDALGEFVDNDPALLDFSPRKKRYLSLVPPGGNWRSLPDEVAQESMGRAYLAKGGRSGWWRRLAWDLPCPTIVTMPNHASTSMCHPYETRVLSIAEFARVQEFPVGWTFAGTVQEQMTQVGNAVPIRLGEVAGEVAADLCRRVRSNVPCSVPRYRRVYLRSHVRTRQWYRNGRVFVWDGVGGAAQYSARRTA